jgi:hypothetical protein
MLSVVKQEGERDYILDLSSLFLDVPVNNTLNLYPT